MTRWWRVLAVTWVAMLCAIASIVVLSTPATAAKTTKTKAEALAWVKAQVGKQLNPDGIYPGQCVDLIMAYYTYLGAARPSGNGYDYATNALPSGWKRIKNSSTFVPEPGDIAVFTGSKYGHVSIVESANINNYVGYDSNWSGLYVQKVSPHPYNWSVTIDGVTYAEKFWGVIRPDWKTTGAFSAAPTPTISGTVAVGGAVAASAGTWSPSASIAYQWQRNQADISGATGSSYTLTTADAGQKIRVRTIGSKSGYTSVTRYSAEKTVPWLGYQAEGTPTITGDATVGNLLTANPGTWNPAPAISYQWKRNGVNIAGATGPTYRTLLADIGNGQALVSVAVTYAKAGYQARTKTATFGRVNATGNGGPVLRSVASGRCADVIGGWDAVANSRRVGIYDCDGGPNQRWNYDSGTRQITVYGTPRKCLDVPADRQMVDGTVVMIWDCTQEPQQQFTFAADGTIRTGVGKCLDLQAGSTENFTSLVINTCSSSATQKFSRWLQSSPPVITGKAKVKKSLRAWAGTWSKGTTLRYQWYANGAPIAGATGTTLKLKKAQQGKRITVRVTGTNPLYVPVTQVSAQTAKVKKAKKAKKRRFW